MRPGWIHPKRIVVKIGSAVIAPSGALDVATVHQIARDVCDVLAGDSSRQVVMVSSGAVASGFRSLGLSKPPKEVVGKQAAAAIGQPRLMRAYAEAFSSINVQGRGATREVGQVLLTAEDIDHRGRFLNARNTLVAMLDAGVVPIINENDSVSFDEIKLGDNDHLAAMVSGLVGADLLIILSSVAGVWEKSALGAVRNGARAIVPELRSLAEAMRHVDSSKTSTGVGGMATKVKAACTAAALGTTAVIADGRVAGILLRVVSGEAIGTLFPSASDAKAIAQRKKWIGLSARPKGELVVDDGARKAILTRGASLLPGGILEVRGEFNIGELVDVRDQLGQTIARGLSSYSAGELRTIRGLKSAQIEATLGYCYRDEAVHRSEMALVDQLAPRAAVRKGGKRG